MRPDNLAALRKLLLEETGLFFPPEKDYLLVSQVEKRVRAGAAPDPDEYVRRLRADAEEFQELINLITIPETYFMREFKFLDLAARVLLPEIISRKGRGAVLSAGSATGEEAYSLVMLARHYNLPMNKLDFLGLDINTRSLQRARAGVFGPFSIRHAEEEARAILAGFTTPGNNGEIRVKEEIRDAVRFEHCNLLKGLKGFGPFDLVLLRNTLIYIQPGMRPRVLMNIRDAMSEGGYLILGQVEIPGGTFGIFAQEKLEGLTVYSKRENKE
jgi:chemotaxis protein methyltransferase CheR